MNKKCITLYDITGIQDFIFSSAKAKENIGASIYVQKVFEEGLTDCLKECFGENSIKAEWTTDHNFCIINKNLNAEVIYIGGGNAMIAFDSKESAIKVTELLSEKILKDTQATLGLAVAYQETSFENFTEDKEALYKNLTKIKNSRYHSTPLRGISINYECEDGLPSSGKTSENIYISDVSAMKIELSKQNYYKQLTPKEYHFPYDFDDLGRNFGDSHLGIVHIDGNNMGLYIDEVMAEVNDYSEAVRMIRNISSKIKTLYQDVFITMVSDLANEINNKVFKDKLILKGKNLPIRPLILNGDDVTFVCDGRIAIQLANKFLELLSKKEIVINSHQTKLSACAGIAIVKSHFPFYRAYELAESLCSSAKLKAKALNKKTPGSWMDYHIVYSGFQLDLDSLRDKTYNVPSMKPVSRKTDFPQYNLLLRPFCVSNDSESYYNWENIQKLFNTMVKWPRNRLKNLRNSFIISQEEVEICRSNNTSRGYCLPEYQINKNKTNNEEIFFENQTPYFEILELLDFYIPELFSEEED